MTLIEHLPSIQILIPFFGALFATISFHYIILARIIAITSIFTSFILSLYGLFAMRNPISYNFGNWNAPIGIEYKLDYLNQPIILYLNFVLLFLLIFCQKLINHTILQFIDNKRQSLFFSILLFAHSGYLGMVSTNDLFNLYIFIEISSLSTYVLIAQGSNNKAVIGAFDYLIFGTIGATLILIGIGFLLSNTGSLNISDIAMRINGQYYSKITIAGISFFLIGSLLKIAFFPMHFWMIRAYSTTSSTILIYLASISTIIGTYIILRFIHSAIDYSKISVNLSYFIRPIALGTIILCSYFAIKARNVRSIIIYSTATQIGYVFLLFSIKGGGQILLSLLLVDSLNKIALFLIISYHEAYNSNDTQSSILWQVLVIACLICSSGLPISSLFILKLNIFNLLIKQNLWLDFLVTLISSSISLLYHYKIAKILLWQHNKSFILNSTNSNVLVPNTKYYGLIFIILLQILLVASLDNISKLNLIL